MIGQKGPVCCD